MRTSGVNPVPHLGAERCDTDGRERPAADGWFRRVAGAGGHVYALTLRFPEPGRWALSLMDREGTFHDFGLRRVRSEPAARSPGGARTPMAIGAALGWFATLADGPAPAAAQRP
jgi:hypothetical protein